MLENMAIRMHGRASYNNTCSRRLARRPHTDVCRDRLRRYIEYDYLEQRSLIPKGQLVEISYDELESQPEEGLDRIYKTLQIQGYDEALPLFRSYLKRMKSYRKNKHFITKELQERILKEWGFAMKEWNYLQPENIEIRHEK